MIVTDNKYRNLGKKWLKNEFSKYVSKIHKCPLTNCAFSIFQKKKHLIYKQHLCYRYRVTQVKVALWWSVLSGPPYIDWQFVIPTDSCRRWYLFNIKIKSISISTQNQKKCKRIFLTHIEIWSSEIPSSSNNFVLAYY